MEGRGNQYALLTMWMVFPNQAAGLQGLLCVDRGALAVKDLGTGSGWQQSRQNWMPAAVVGQRIRMESSSLCSVETAPLHPTLLLLSSILVCSIALSILLCGLRAILFSCPLAWHCDVFML